MAQQLSPWLEGAYGWAFGENGWNDGMDTNLLKFSFLFDRNVDSIVASLPSAVNGQAHYLTTDNRLYFAVGTTYYSTVVPKWFTVIVRSTGVAWQFNGTTLVQVDSSADLDVRIDAVEITVASLGTAAFEDIEFFSTQAELDIVEANAQAYTDTLRADLLDSTDPLKGATLVGYLGGTVSDVLDSINQRTVESFGAVGDGVTNDTPALHLAFAWLQAGAGRTLVFGAGLTYLQGAGADEVMYESNSYFPARFNLSDQSNMKIVGNGATIVADTSLTDTQFNRGIWFIRCPNVTVWDLGYDGRLDARTPFGSDAFNGGNELTGNQKSGIAFVNCRDFMCYRVKSNRTMMDGFFPAYEIGVANSQSRGVFLNCEGMFNYRQGLSIVGMSGGFIIGGEYSDTGNLGVGKGTNPMAGIDIEGDAGLNPLQIGNTIIGVTCARNKQGISFAFGAQNNRAINCQILENRLYGVSFALDNCSGNSVEGGKITQTLPSSESATRAATIGKDFNGLVGVQIQVATPHRGVDFANDATCIDCYVRDCVIQDVAPATDVTSLPFLLFMSPSAFRPKVTGTTIKNCTGTGHAVTIDCPTGEFIGNTVTSAHGASGARGLIAITAGNVSGNTGRGTRVDTAVDSSVFNISGSATLVKQFGPNLDEALPRLGAKVRRVGFDGGPYYFSSTYNPPSLAAGASANTSVTVTGALVGDLVDVALGSAGAGLTSSGLVTATNTVRVDVTNVSGGVLDVGSTVLNIIVTPA